MNKLAIILFVIFIVILFAIVLFALTDEDDTGTPCTNDSQCFGTKCDISTGRCLLINGIPCSSNDECDSNICSSGICTDVQDSLDDTEPDDEISDTIILPPVPRDKSISISSGSCIQRKHKRSERRVPKIIYFGTSTSSTYSDTSTSPSISSSTGKSSSTYSDTSSTYDDTSYYLTRRNNIISTDSSSIDRNYVSDSSYSSYSSYQPHKEHKSKRKRKKKCEEQELLKISMYDKENDISLYEPSTVLDNTIECIEYQGYQIFIRANNEIIIKDTDLSTKTSTKLINDTVDQLLIINDDLYSISEGVLNLCLDVSGWIWECCKWSIGGLIHGSVINEGQYVWLQDQYHGVLYQNETEIFAENINCIRNFSTDGNHYIDCEQDSITIYNNNICGGVNEERMNETTYRGVKYAMWYDKIYIIRKDEIYNKIRFFNGEACYLD